MKLSTTSFRGMAPRVTPRALPDNASQQAINPQLLTGDLQPWKRPVLLEALANAGVVRSIYLFQDVWLSYDQAVEFARGAILGDDEDARIYITGLDAPRFTTYSLATSTQGPPYPGETRLLGVPAPDTPPTVAVSIPDPVESNITLTNPGAEAGNTSGWVITTGGLVALDATDVPGLLPQAGNFFFGGGAVAATEAYQAIDLEALGLIAGQGLSLTWWQAAGANQSTAGMAIQFYDETAALMSTVASEQTAGTLAWLQRTLTTQVPDGAVTARLVQQYTRVGGGDLDAYIDTIAIGSIAYTNAFDGSSLSGWQVSPNTGSVTGNTFRRVEIDPAVGWPAPSIRFRGDSRVPYIYRDFSTDRSPSVVLQFDYEEIFGRTDCGLHALLFASGGGAGTSVFFSSWIGVRLYTHPDWDNIGANVEQIAPSLPAGIRYTVTLTATQTSETAAGITIRVVNAESGAVVVDNETATISVDGPNIGFKAAVNFNDRRYWLDNIAVTVAAPDPTQTDETTYTSYVYTLINEFGEESAPSDASDTVQRNENGTTTVTTPTTIPTGVSDEYGVTTKRIYRAATGALGSVFRFVAEIPLAQADYVDTLTDAQLGEELESTDFDLPPSDLRYILALPNGIMVGASGNRLCFSAQNRPHAWPVGYRLATDSPITGLGNADTTVVVGTETFVYTASGNSPDSYSMSKPVAPHACVSARGIAYVTGIGVVFPGPDGLMAVTGPTEVRNVSAPFFTRDQWQDIVPAAILAFAHDDVYYFFGELGETYDPGSVILLVNCEDNDASDESIYGHAPTVSTLILTSPGLVGDYNVANNPAASGGSVSYSISLAPIAWDATRDVALETFVQISEEQNNRIRLLSVGVTGGDTAFQVRLNVDGSGVTLEVNLFLEIQSNLALPTFEYGRRYHVAAQYTGSATVGNRALLVFIDGQLVLTKVATMAVSYTQILSMTPWSIDSNEVAEPAGWARFDGARYTLDRVRWTSNFTPPTTAPIDDGGTPVDPDAPTATIGYALDLKPDGFGLIKLGLHACALAVDLERDALVMVLDAYEEPESALLPPATGVVFDTDGQTLYEWNGGTEDMRYLWTGKLWLNPSPKAWEWVRVRAADFDDLAIEFYANGALLYSRVVTSNRPFRLPVRSDYDEIYWTAIGTSRVRSVEIADDILELD